jgi:hypothetical protein
MWHIVRVEKRVSKEYIVDLIHVVYIIYQQELTTKTDSANAQIGWLFCLIQGSNTYVIRIVVLNSSFAIEQNTNKKQPRKIFLSSIGYEYPKYNEQKHPQ